MRVIAFMQRVLASGVLVAGAASAQSGKPVSLVVPFPAGGPSDVIARLVVPELSKRLASPILVENVSGVGGALAVQKVLNAPADGQSVLVGSPMELVLAPLGVAAVKYQPEDTRLIALLGQTTVALYVRKDFPAQTVEQLVAHARKNPHAPLSYGSAGAGSLLHLVAERFRAQTGIEMLHVPYKGTTPLVPDLIGGQIDMVFLPFGGSMLGLVDSGKVRLLGLAATGRDARYPDVPALGEGGLLKDFVYDSWLGLQVPRKTPQAVVERLGRAAREVMQMPQTQQAIAATGGRPAAPMSLSELDNYYANEIARYRAAAKAVNLQPQ